VLYCRRRESEKAAYDGNREVHMKAHDIIAAWLAARRSAGLFFALLTLAAGLLLAAGPLAWTAKAVVPEVLDREVPCLMEAGGVPGLTVAVIEEGHIAWTGAFGVRSTDTDEPVDELTMFEAASMTKPVTAYVAALMIDRGELEIDRPLAEYLRDDRFEDAERYEALTARHVMTHTTGLPNWGAVFEADPGERFGYSGEGFAYLGRVLAEISGTPLEELVAREVFEPLGMERSSMVSPDDYAENAATGHDRHGHANPLRVTSEPNAGASLVTTATDYAKFLIAVMDGVGLSQSTLELVLTPEVPVRDWRSGEPDSSVFWGLGWGLQPSRGGQAYWHWGNNVDLRGYATADPGTKTGIVYFANGESGHSVARELVGLVVSDHQWAMDWLGFNSYGDPEWVMLLEMESAYEEGGVEAGEAHLAGLIAEHADSLDPHTIEQASHYLRSRELTDEAFSVLNQLIAAHPGFADAYGHRADLHMETGNFDESLADLERLHELRPDDAEIERYTVWLSELVSSIGNQISMPDDVLARFAGDYGPRHVSLREHRLYYQRDGRDEYLLSPMDEFTFRLEDYPSFRIRFVVEDEEGPATKLVGIYLDGRIDESVRDRPDEGD
jgi:CubicO group peptidase (beta-lactamase class C family)